MIDRSLLELAASYGPQENLGTGYAFTVTYLSAIGEPLQNVSAQNFFTIPQSVRYKSDISKLMSVFRSTLYHSTAEIVDARHRDKTIEDAGGLLRALAHTSPNKRSIDGMLQRICNRHLFDHEVWESASLTDIGARILAATNVYNFHPEYGPQLQIPNALVEFEVILKGLDSPQPLKLFTS